MATHQDQFADETKYSNQDRVDHFESFNPKSTDNIAISNSDITRQEIELQKPLLAAMAREHRYEPEEDGQCVDAIFNAALCDVAELALEEAGLDEQTIGLDRLRALLIQEARGINTYGELADYIGSYSSDDIERLGLENTYGKSWYRKAARQLETTGEDDLLCDATFIAVHALWWNGVPIPKTVRHRYDLDYSAGPDAGEFPEPARQLALYTLVEDLLEIVVENFALGDVEHTPQELRHVLGAFAHDSITGRSIERYTETARHLFDLESALHGSTVRKHIDADELSVADIEAMFDDIYQALFEYAVESGVVSEPILISYDRTDIENLESDDVDEPYYTEDGRLRFYSLAATDPDLEFAFRLRLVSSKAKRPDVLTNFLRDLTSMADVRLYMADAEFDGVTDLEVPRLFMPGNWIIHAQETTETGVPTDAYERLREKIAPGGTAAVRNAGPDDLHPPVKLVGYSKANETDETPDPIEAFYTDQSLPSDKADRQDLIEKIYFLYNQRDKIEAAFGMAKDDFGLTSDTDKPARKTFYFHVSFLFYNLYKMVNTVPAPNNGLELDTTQSEFLQVVRNLAFDGPTAPEALTYLQEHS